MIDSLVYLALVLLIVVVVIFGLVIIRLVDTLHEWKRTDRRMRARPLPEE